MADNNGHSSLPRWMEFAPLVGAFVLAVPVAAQRGFTPTAVLLVTAIAVIAVLDFLGWVPKFLCTATVLGAVYLLLRSGEPEDVAPFYLVALTAATAAANPTRVSLAVTAASYAVLTAAWAGHADTIGGIIVWMLGIGLAYLGGAGVAAQARLAAELQAAQEDLASRSAEGERQRIAREVHDVIAHSLTVTMLHLTGARLSLDSGDPQEAVSALREAERLGLQSLADIRRVVGMLGSSDALGEPQPSAIALPALFDDYRRAGLEVDSTIRGDLETLSPATSLAVYRITQEALANVGRHGGTTVASTVIDVGESCVSVIVRNSVVVPVHTLRSPRSLINDHGGLGVAGMRARAAALGGTCTAGLAADGSWELRAVLPTSSA